MIYIKPKTGLGVVEVVVAAAIILTASVVLAASLRAMVIFSRHTADNTQAAIMLEEGSEALLSLRDVSWTNNFASVDLGEVYYLTWSGSIYNLSTTTAVIDNKYRRQVVFSSVARDVDGVIDAGGDTDPDTLMASITIYLNSSNESLATGNTLIHNAYED